MRNLAPVGWGLFVVTGIAAGLLWRELRTDRQLIEDLREQLAETRTVVAARPPSPPVAVTAVAEATLQPSVAAQPVGAAPVAAPARITREEAMAVLNADSAKRQKALLADAGYRKALLAQARADLQTHYAGLRVELGLSENEANALFDLLAEAQVRTMTSMTAFESGAQPDAAAVAEMQRLMLDQQKVKDQLTAMLGPQRYAQFEEYDRIQPSRTRVNNLTTLLARSGRPLTNAQTRSLTAAMVTEQKRMEAEAKAIRDAGQTDKRSPADIQAETNRHLLEQIPSFLDSQQVTVVRGRFEERSTIDRAADRLQQREREVLQATPN